ncbi:hypothetical protein FA13DRAFT_1753516 [Coprinellus micaceus]|uniref:hAT-like transposase RNase-H fold domain-containing protein n=1 Tax=Coprinellus micaceus TaxID=71717 RepID=A0A4Y7TKE0_COPMI|nr:hypothetical protein FA13DRAFT_1753516 [Coprinellus micaceus]
MFVSFFFKKRKPSKKIKAKADGTEELVDADADVDGYDDVEDDEVVRDEVEVDDAELADDDGSVAYNKAVVSGLARRVHDSAVLKERFDNLVAGDPTQNGMKHSLDRRVPTRWNSDHACLKAHLHFRKQVEQLTGLSENKLHAYRLTDGQWTITKELVEALAIFEEPSHLFSTASVPLIVDVLPAFDDLRVSLKGLRDYEEAPISPVLQVAAEAALLMVDKYEKLSWDCDIYYVAVVMCPDRKLQWFKDRDYDRKTLKYIRELVIKHFNDGYNMGSDQGQVQQLAAVRSTLCSTIQVRIHSRQRWHLVPDPEAFIRY